MNRFLIAGLFLFAAGCDQVHYQNAMDPDGTAYHPHRIGIAAYPAGAGTTGFDDSSVAGPSVALSATAAPGWIFHHWSGQGTANCTANPCDYAFPDTAPASLRAVFIPSWTESDSVVLEDFDFLVWNGNQFLNGFAYAAWASSGERIPQTGYWAAWYGPSSSFTPDSATFAKSDWRGALVPLGGPDGSTSFHAHWSVAGSGYAGFLTYFLDVPYPVDLTTMDRIEFDAKGTGSVAVGFRTEASARLGNYELVDTLVALHAGWTHYSIPLTSFSCSAGRSPVLKAANLSRADLFSSVIGINFQSAVRGDVDISLDRIVLHGQPGSKLFQAMVARLGL